jgi:hypothetical protein
MHFNAIIFTQIISKYLYNTLADVYYIVYAQQRNK